MMLAQMIYLVLILSFIFILVYKVYFITPFTQYKDSFYSENLIDFPIFLLISVKNESKRLANVLSSTNSGEFRESGSKIIVVDDYSEEVEFKLMQDICSDYKNVEFIKSRNSPGKKHALRYAIKEFPSDYYAFTDADCIIGEKWFRAIKYSFKSGDFVMGYAPFEKKKTLLNSLQRYECMWIASQYMGFTLRKMPYMAVGRNMGATAELLSKTIPQMQGDHLMSGDDDMLVQALEKDTKISLMIHPDSFAKSESEGTYFRYLKQKTRQISTSVHYKLKHKILLGGISTSLITFYLISILLLFLHPIIGITSLLSMGILNLLIFWVPTQKFKEKDIKWKVMFLEPIYVINLVILAIYSILPKKKMWK